jgi:hypothetical protein
VDKPQRIPAERLKTIQGKAMICPIPETAYSQHTVAQADPNRPRRHINDFLYALAKRCHGGAGSDIIAKMHSHLVDGVNAIALLANQAVFFAYWHCGLICALIVKPENQAIDGVFVLLNFEEMRRRPLLPPVIDTPICVAEYSGGFVEWQP